MFKDLSILQTASALARHSAQRHSVVAENIANADTPGFKAKDLEPFAAAYARSAYSGADKNLVQYREVNTHAPGAASPNGNTVSLEDEMMRGAAATRDHDTAITLYAKTLDMLRIALGRR